jgi:hypothetical protein
MLRELTIADATIGPCTRGTDQFLWISGEALPSARLQPSWMESEPTIAQQRAATLHNVNCRRVLYSDHGDGAFISMCDGSVRWLDNSTLVTTAMALFTRDAGDTPEYYDQLLERKQ